MARATKHESSGEGATWETGREAPTWQASPNCTTEKIGENLTKSEQAAVAQIRTWYEKSAASLAPNRRSEGEGNYGLIKYYQSKECLIRIQENIEKDKVEKVYVRVQTPDDERVLTVAFVPGRRGVGKISTLEIYGTGSRAALQKAATGHHGIPGLSKLAQAALRQLETNNCAPMK